MAKIFDFLPEQCDLCRTLIIFVSKQFDWRANRTRIKWFTVGKWNWWRREESMDRKRWEVPLQQYNSLGWTRNFLPNIIIILQAYFKQKHQRNGKRLSGKIHFCHFCGRSSFRPPPPRLSSSLIPLRRFIIERQNMYIVKLIFYPTSYFRFIKNFLFVQHKKRFFSGEGCGILWGDAFYNFWLILKTRPSEHEEPFRHLYTSINYLYLSM